MTHPPRSNAPSARHQAGLRTTVITLGIALLSAAWLPLSALAQPATPAASASAPASAAAPAPADPAFHAAAALFMRGSTGDTAAAQAAAGQFEALLQQRPADPVVMAYAGAATAMRAAGTWLPWKKLAYAEDGLARLDKALALLEARHDTPLYRGTPASLETRFVAASTFLRLPASFNRRDQGEKLIRQVLASAAFDTAPMPFKAAVWLRAGTAAAPAHPAEARTWLQRAAASGVPQPAAAAQAALKEFKL